MTLAVTEHLKLLIRLQMLNYRVNGVWKGIMRTIDLARSYEYVKTYDVLKCLQPGENVLDIGSFRTILPVFLAHNTELNVTASDIESGEFGSPLALQKKVLQSIPLDIDIREADATTLVDDLPEMVGNLKAVTIISTIEHIRDDGDVKAMKNIAKMLKRKGLCLVSVPFGPQYLEKEDKGFFERVYDETALYERLINPTGLRVVQIKYFGSKNVLGARFESMYMRKDSKIIYYLTRFLRAIFFLSFPFLCGELTNPQKAGGVFFVLENHDG